MFFDLNLLDSKNEQARREMVAVAMRSGNLSPHAQMVVLNTCRKEGTPECFPATRGRNYAVSNDMLALESRLMTDPSSFIERRTNTTMQAAPQFRQETEHMIPSIAQAAGSSKLVSIVVQVMMVWH
jgi:hypothetical protein